MIEGIIGKKMQLWKSDEAKCAVKNDSDMARKDSNDIAHYWILSKREMDENNNGLLNKQYCLSPECWRSNDTHSAAM